MPVRIAPLLVLALSLIALPSCAARGYEAEPYASVTIINDSAMQVNVHALRDGTRVRIGTVPGVTTQTFPLRTDMIGAGNQLRMVIDPVGSAQNYQSYPIVVSQGDNVELRVSSLIR